MLFLDKNNRMNNLIFIIKKGFLIYDFEVYVSLIKRLW